MNATSAAITVATSMNATRQLLTISLLYQYTTWDCTTITTCNCVRNTHGHHPSASASQTISEATYSVISPSVTKSAPSKSRRDLSTLDRQQKTPSVSARVPTEQIANNSATSRN